MLCRFEVNNISKACAQGMRPELFFKSRELILAFIKQQIETIIYTCIECCTSYLKQVRLAETLSDNLAFQ